MNTKKKYKLRKTLRSGAFLFKKTTAAASDDQREALKEFERARPGVRPVVKKASKSRDEGFAKYEKIIDAHKISKRNIDILQKIDSQFNRLINEIEEILVIRN